MSEKGVGKKGGGAATSRGSGGHQVPGGMSRKPKRERTNPVAKKPRDQRSRGFWGRRRLRSKRAEKNRADKKWGGKNKVNPGTLNYYKIERRKKETRKRKNRKGILI